MKLGFLMVFILFNSYVSSQESKSKYIDLLSRLENSDSTKFLFKSANKALAWALKNGDVELQAKAMYAQAGVYNKIREHQKAIEKGYEIIKLGEKNNLSNIESDGYHVLGTSEFSLHEHEKAIFYFKKAEIKIIPINGDSSEIYIIRNNIGTIYTSLPHKSLKDLDTALMYFKRAEHKSTTTDYKNRTVECLKYGNLYSQKNRYSQSPEFFSKAMSYYDSALKYSRYIEDKSIEGKILTNKAKLLYDSDQKELALKEYLKAQKISEKHKDYTSLLIQYDYIRYLYELQNNADSAYNYRENWVAVNDSLHKYESLQQANELEIKYETEKKEQENLLLTKDNEKKQLGIYFSIGGLILLIGVIFLIYRNSIQKTKTNKLLGHKNIIIEEQNKNITDSIKYAQRIQGAILPPNKMWFSIFPRSFVLYKPKDILSGDFYWTEETEDWKFVGAADCTGHGVPGALMSIVNFNLLNKAVLEKNLTMPGEILDSVNQQLTLALHQTYQESTVKDGMDITLLSINKKTNEVYFAGANNPIYILGVNKDIEMKGDKFPVGAFVGETIRSFTTHKLQLEQGDRVFLFSDGYADQFGGPKGKKLKYKQMKDTLTESLKMDYKEQKNHLDKTFNNWRGNLEQVDDVLVVGLDIS